MPALLIVVAAVAITLGIAYSMSKKNLEIAETRLSEARLLYANEQIRSEQEQKESALPEENKLGENTIDSIGGVAVIESIKPQGTVEYFIEPTTGFGLQKVFLGEFVAVGTFKGEEFKKMSKQNGRIKIDLKYLQPGGGAQLFINGAGDNLSLDESTPTQGQYVKIGYNGKLNNILGLSFASKDCQLGKEQAYINGITWKDGAYQAETKRVYAFKQPIRIPCYLNDMYGEEVMTFFNGIDESSLSSDLSSFDISLVNGQKLHIQLPKENAPTVTIK